MTTERRELIILSDTRLTGQRIPIVSGENKQEATEEAQNVDANQNIVAPVESSESRISNHDQQFESDGESCKSTVTTVADETKNSRKKGRDEYYKTGMDLLAEAARVELYRLYQVLDDASDVESSTSSQ